MHLIHSESFISRGKLLICYLASGILVPITMAGVNDFVSIIAVILITTRHHDGISTLFGTTGDACLQRAMNSSIVQFPSRSELASLGIWFDVSKNPPRGQL